MLIVPIAASAVMLGFLLPVRGRIIEIQTVAELVTISLGGMFVYIAGVLIVDHLIGGQMSLSFRQRLRSQFARGEE